MVGLFGVPGVSKDYEKDHHEGLGKSHDLVVQGGWAPKTM